jgi:hypothetical protein
MGKLNARIRRLEAHATTFDAIRVLVAFTDPPGAPPHVLIDGGTRPATAATSAYSRVGRCWAIMDNLRRDVWRCGYRQGARHGRRQLVGSGLRAASAMGHHSGNEHTACPDLVFALE